MDCVGLMMQRGWRTGLPEIEFDEEEEDVRHDMDTCPPCPSETYKFW